MSKKMLKSYLSIADMLYSGHLSIADRIAGSRRITLYSGHLDRGYMVIPDSF